jgi:hypothetical protein
LWPPPEAGCFWSHSSESLQFLQFLPYVLLGLANESCVSHLLFFSGFQVKGGVQVEGPHKCSLNWLGLSSDLWKTSDVFLVFIAFFPPSFMPLIMPSDTGQAVGSLIHH